MVEGQRFDPARTVAAGTTVTWTSESGGAHTVTALEEPSRRRFLLLERRFEDEAAAREGLSKALIPEGGTFSATFGAPAYRYVCLPHEGRA